jgi:hypothetical protein
MKAGKKGYAYYLAMIFPLLTAGCVFLIYNNSFVENAMFSEEVSMTFTYYTLIAGGVLGTLTAIYGLYQILRYKRIWVIIIRVIILFPFLFMTCVILYGFLVLENVI